MATTRRTRAGTAAVPAKGRTSTTRARRSDGSQLLMAGGIVLLVGVIYAVVVAGCASNDTHPAIRYSPWLPIVIGLGLLGWALAKVSTGRSRSDPGDALEPR
jgi:hypothetical protein